MWVTFIMFMKWESAALFLFFSCWITDILLPSGDGQTTVVGSRPPSWQKYTRGAEHLFLLASRSMHLFLNASHYFKSRTICYMWLHIRSESSSNHVKCCYNNELHRRRLIHNGKKQTATTVSRSAWSWGESGGGPKHRLHLKQSAVPELGHIYTLFIKGHKLKNTLSLKSVMFKKIWLFMVIY